jgi:hypothetical protein
MTIYYLYMKTHQKTGLKYLGYTQRNPYEYVGSGSYWTWHLKKHGYNIDTEVLLETTSKDEIKSVGQYYSQKWNIVEARGDNDKKLWANLKPEEGRGGSIPRKTPVPEYVGKKISAKLTGRVNGPHSPERCANISKSKQGHNKGKLYEEIYSQLDATRIRNNLSSKMKEYLASNPGIRNGNNNGNAKHYEFLDPTGYLHYINGNIVPFCLEHKLNLTGVYKCINGKVDRYKDWQIKRLNV